MLIYHSQSRYQYAPLIGENDFRCFDLAPGHWEEPLRGEFTVLSLLDEPDFEAVSYTWSSEGPTTGLQCGRGVLIINNNVAVMLRRLRLQDRPRRLWVDAICIEQCNKQEKSIQVQRMSQIYSQCSRLIIWLGEEDLSTRDAIDLLHDLDAVVDKAWNLCGATWPTLESLFSCGIPHISDIRWACFSTLLHNRWFTRTWVLQEVALSVNPWIHRGSFAFDWKKLVRIVLSIYDFYKLDWVNTVSVVCSSTRSWWHDPSLMALLHLTANFSSTLKVDRVFALLGLSAERSAFQHLVRYPDEDTDDTAEAERVYSEVAIYFLTRGYLGVLNVASDPSLRDLNRLPTWVPDWSSWTRACPMAQPLHRAEQLYKFSSIRKLKLAPRVSGNRKVLILRGTVVDRISRVGRRLPLLKKITDRIAALTFISQWRHIAENKNSRCRYNNLDEAFALTVTMTPPSEVLQLHRFTGIYRRYLEQFPGLKWLPKGFDGKLAHISGFHARLIAMCGRRTFFITEIGYMGVGPYFSRPGDHVAKFDGGVTPFVIRKAKDGCYSLVGDAHVHGMMDMESGEAAVTDIHLI